MIVYVVVFCEIDGGGVSRTIQGVFKTSEAAKSYIKKLHEDRKEPAYYYDDDYEWLEVEEWPVEES